MRPFGSCERRARGRAYVRHLNIFKIRVLLDGCAGFCRPVVNKTWVFRDTTVNKARHRLEFVWAGFIGSLTGEERLVSGFTLQRLLPTAPTCSVIKVTYYFNNSQRFYAKPVKMLFQGRTAPKRCSQPPSPSEYCCGSHPLQQLVFYNIVNGFDT